MKESVAIVLKYQNEIYGIVRAQDRPAFPGYFSFPGGICELADQGSATNGAWPPQWPLHKTHHASTIIRELQEETAIELQTQFAQNNILAISYLGQATTPDFNPVRFDTFYYLIEFKQRPAINLCQREFKSGQWATAEQHLKRYQQCHFPMVPVTRWLLEKILKEQVPPYQLNLTYDAKRVVPMISPVAGVEQFLALSPTLPPATRTNCFYIGDESQPKILIDPSPIDEAEYQRLINALGERRVDAILLTHHHPDHHHLSPQLAQHYKVPLLMSEKTHQLAKKKISPQYFGQNRIEFVSEVDLLTYSQDVPVKLMAVPGHDVGQLAPYRADGGWFIAGDLIQTVGTVVIGDEEGDMAAYFRSMQAVIDFNPRIVFPSHGIAMGGVHQLRATLEHRKLREGQILDLLKAGADEHKIFSVVYAGLPPQLERYARKTIQAHIKKIHDEKLL